MENTINFGIDLGTTNSAIAKFTKGNVEVFKHSVTWKETLPSVIYFRKDRVFVGDKAKEYVIRDPKNVISRFKRKMGTTETFKIPSINQSKTPVNLSAEILKELKTFLPPNESIESVVITIPASFDTIQSNATKRAGEEAGFKQVVLLEEPIAASMAYANKKKEKELEEGQWLVYDLGGGTFDVALVKIKDGEMKVLDHEGNNFLGGTDFDDEIIKQIIIPKLEKIGQFTDLENQMTSASGRYNKEFLKFRLLAEKLKIALSSQTSEDIEIQIEDENGETIDEFFSVSRSEFENIIKESVDSSIELVKKILVRNSLGSKDLQFVLMVGGSTFIPFIRQRVGELLQVPVNFDIDPTTAIAIGAAHYAGTKPKITEKQAEKQDVQLKVRMAYQKASKEKEEYFAAKVEGDIEGLTYRITREDGGFDTGLKPLDTRINEDLPLVENTYNFFKLTVFDSFNNIVETDAEVIGINAGGITVIGQSLPEDICIEIDDLETGESALELIFQKNAVLPLRTIITKPLNRTLIKGSDEGYRINVLEGSHSSRPESNKPIGLLEINGNQIIRDISKGSDIEINVELDESRTLSVSAYLTMADQEFKQIFNPKERHVSAKILTQQVQTLSERLDTEITEAEELV
ncbi:Hsp70 family protein [Bernardetia sp.]|uniref:Hsp70 family protein n=1 Tax=Bernardetia sp. TaxID=1937974 RepID=UPI0025BD7305|nr:Hsp70 family protein [Bernardetia sp.]